MFLEMSVGYIYIYIYTQRILDSHKAPYGTCEVVLSKVRSSTAISKEKRHRRIENIAEQ